MTSTSSLAQIPQPSRWQGIPALASDPKAKAKLLEARIGHFKVAGEHKIDVLSFAPGLEFEAPDGRSLPARWCGRADIEPGPAGATKTRP
jgi:hypothetical protein